MKGIVSMTRSATADPVGAAFVTLRSRLGAYLRRQVRDQSVAEDLLQQVFLKAVTTLQSERSVGNLSGWLYSVARTTAIDYHRANRMHFEDDVEDIPAEDSTSERLQQELASCLMPLAETLPTIYRDTLIAADFRGQTLRSVASAEGVSVSAIKSRASRARALLKGKLLKCCVIEMSHGNLADYHPKADSGCKGKCC